MHLAGASVSYGHISSWFLIYSEGLGSLTNNFCPAKFEKFILQRASKFYNGYKI